MSTEIETITGRYEESHNGDFTCNYGKSEIDITRFYGGKDNGAMLQITINNGNGIAYTQLTREQVELLADVLRDSLDYSVYPSD